MFPKFAFVCKAPQRHTMAKTKKTEKKTKLEDLKWLDGKAAPDANANIKSIDDIIGVTLANPFKAKTIEEFEKKIDTEMNLADMQALASKVGLLPIADRPLLKKRLLDEFRKDSRKRTPYNVKTIQAKEGLNLEMSARAKKILGEGR